MAGITNSQLMIEMKDMRKEFNARVDVIGENMHQLDKKVEVHLVDYSHLETVVGKNFKALFGNNGENEGIKSVVKDLDEAKKIKEVSVRKTWLDVRTALIVFALTTAGQYLLSQII